MKLNYFAKLCLVENKHKLFENLSEIIDMTQLIVQDETKSFIKTIINDAVMDKKRDAEIDEKHKNPTSFLFELYHDLVPKTCNINELCNRTFQDLTVNIYNEVKTINNLF
jgi:hypothetical protein